MLHIINNPKYKKNKQNMKFKKLALLFFFGVISMNVLATIPPTYIFR